MSEQIGFVTAVHIFPIKSCHEATINGQLPNALTIGQTGFEHNGVVDRGWVIADQTDLFVSQRGWDAKKARKYASDSKLATVNVDIRHDHLAVEVDGQRLSVPYESDTAIESTVQMFDTRLNVIDEGQEAADFFSDLLGRAVRLARANPQKPRYLPHKYQRPLAANQSAAADGRPFSLGSHASLDYLHDLAGLKRGTVNLSRYRTNIDIGATSLEPFIEDRVKLWRLGSRATFHQVKALSRCPVPNINQDTGSEEGKLSNKLLIPNRLGWSVGEDQSLRAEPFFAQSLNHTLASIGSIVMAGDIVWIEETGESNFIAKNKTN